MSECGTGPERQARSGRIMDGARWDGEIFRQDKAGQRERERSVWDPQVVRRKGGETSLTLQGWLWLIKFWLPCIGPSLTFILGIRTQPKSNLFCQGHCSSAWSTPWMFTPRKKQICEFAKKNLCKNFSSLCPPLFISSFLLPSSKLPLPDMNNEDYAWDMLIAL